MHKKYYDARQILGDDFISPSEIAKARNLIYSKEVLAYLIKTLPSKDTLLWLVDNEYVLMAGPPSRKSLLGIRDLSMSCSFCKPLSGWYTERKERFSREGGVSIGWSLLRKNHVKNSTNTMWSEQLELLSEDEYVPSVSVMAWAITTYKEVRNILLFSDIHVRTASICSNGNHVDTGVSKGMIVINGHHDYFEFDEIGLASGLKH